MGEQVHSSDAPARPVRLVILGRQGSGKGTQGALLTDHYGAIHISTGDMLREAVAARTDLGVRAAKIMDAGELVPDELMVDIVEARLAQADVATRGFLLDGFPRTPAQADALEKITADRPLDAAINLDVPVSEVTARMVARGRGDDTPEGIARRLELYEQETAPLLEWFATRDLLHTVDGLGLEPEVFGRLVAVVDAACA